ncbi:PepSY domain-containing protein [Maribacter sp. 2307ULW6-5]|uniref:PepSY domain-containing protein n=1 Tax=Maribacter sp. 2307ULW6-5 TaxID=3386275 RepID=UPI0039BCE88A
MKQEKNRQRRQRQAKVLRITRKAHRVTGICLFAFFVFIATTGMLLGWKKNSGNLILPKTYQGSSTELEEWLSLDELKKRAVAAYSEKFGPNDEPVVDRMDVRANKGTLKVRFKNHYHEVQLDGATGAVLHAGKRRSDLLEQIHDGSIIDKLFGFDLGAFKLVYTSVMGTALLIFTGTGFWLWYGPKRMRREQG